MRLRYVILLLAGLVAACASITEGLRQKAGIIAANAGMQGVEIPAGPFTLQLYERIRDPALPVRVYIEGDGNAWLTSSQISPDPTPLDPVALKLALRDNAANVVYMARPCQYVTSDACRPKVWTYAQFNESVIASVNQAMNRWRGHKLELVGYSGGAAVALLVAARRDDVISIRTVAGNVDSEAFTTLHRVSPLSESLNPASGMERTAMIPQRHFAGEKDSVVPPSLVESYQNRLPVKNCSAYDVVAGIDHYSGWPEQWPALLAEPLPCH